MNERSRKELIFICSNEKSRSVSTHICRQRRSPSSHSDFIEYIKAYSLFFSRKLTVSVFAKCTHLSDTANVERWTDKCLLQCYERIFRQTPLYCTVTSVKGLCVSGDVIVNEVWQMKYSSFTGSIFLWWMKLATERQQAMSIIAKRITYLL